MKKILLNLFFIAVLFLAYSCQDESVEKDNTAELLTYYDPLENETDAVSAGEDYQENEDVEIVLNDLAGPDITPSPAAIGVSAGGEIFVGVDMIGSLGKEPGKGSVVRILDSDNDGEADSHTEFVKVNNPRGIIAMGDKVFILHSTFSEETGKAMGQDLVVFEDKDEDGVADGPATTLIKNISSRDILQQRGADHATNGIRMGIDGWIYIAVGDFGFQEATDRAGNKLSMLGGGIVRVRPDGTEMEVYTHGMRNIYDMAIDPFMNIYTRGNTNDGGGWNIRFSHHIQTGEYGYPILFQNFTDEIIPALVDVGGGSGTGAYFMDDDTWPRKYNHVPMMADWGRSELFIHRVTPSGPTFEQEEEEFIELAQITDLDMDASGRLYLTAWDGAGYSGSDDKGFVVRAVPEDWEYEPFPDLEKLPVEELAALLKSGNSVARLSAQQELLQRSGHEGAALALEIAEDESLPLESRVAGIYTYAQAAGEGAIAELVDIAEDRTVREYALRALADRMIYSENVPLEPFYEALEDPSERIQVAAITGLGRLGRKEAAQELLKVEVPPSLQAPDTGTEGSHATPNPSVIKPHVAVKALVALNAVDASLDAVGTDNSRLALWALRYMHEPEVVDGLIAAYHEHEDEALRVEILNTLARLYHKEAPVEESRWWGTRPTAPGPYYNAVSWESTSRIGDFLMGESEDATVYEMEFFQDLNTRFQLEIEEFAEEEIVQQEEEIEVDLEKIQNEKGQVGKASIEDVLLAMQEIEGDAARGKAVYDRQGCVACHSITPGEAMKGPYLGQIGSIMNREQIAESILKPNASISQGFATYLINTSDGQAYMGFITKESADEVEIRNITGEKFTIQADDIVKREKLENSMMPAGLANSLSYEEFASMLTYLSQQKE